MRLGKYGVTSRHALNSNRRIHMNTSKTLICAATLFAATLGSAVAQEYVLPQKDVERSVDILGLADDGWVESTCVSGDGQVTKVCDDLCIASETTATCLKTVPPSSSE